MMPHYIHIHNLDNTSPQKIKIKYCDTFLCRLRGLTFSPPIALDFGLLLVQKADSRMDASIHMLGVSFDLAVIWIDASMQVVDKVLAESWHLSYTPKSAAKYVLEIHPENLGAFEIGDKVQFEDF